MATLETLTDLLTAPTLLTATLIVLLTTFYLTLLRAPSFPPNAPPHTKETYPLLGAWFWFSERWDFHQRASAASPTGNFSFFAGPLSVISIASDSARRVFFESKDLHFNAGYQPLLAGATQGPPTEGGEEDEQFSKYFHKRLTELVKRGNLNKSLPRMMGDVRGAFERLVADGPGGVTDPFVSVYGLVHQLTMRQVGCNDVADDLGMLRKTLGFFEMIEKTGTPLTVMYSWLPTWGKLKRSYAGMRLYMIFKRVADERRRTGRRDEDAMQYMIDAGDDNMQMLTLIVGSLFAGQLNSGVNAAWILLFLATNPTWFSQTRTEVLTAANKHSPSTVDLPLRDRLPHIPLEAWESEFPLLDLCLKESIRLVSHGNGFRRNTTAHPIPLDAEAKEIVPPGAFVTFATGTVHMNPDIYPNPHVWDPARYFPERAEDKKRQYAWMGWGHARHPCLGMKFAKLENTVICAFWLAFFDFELVDAEGRATERLPPRNSNEYAAEKPGEKCWLRYRLREE